ncbi:truncated hemoglobin YjbI [Roseiarcus fermentans]|uniref:Truncated hemoglobin YjbI n=1 Tax=Roseiarcus fermentans TaxID=1473586 RepID=A0A366F1T1_9HYPH|nr:group III truncated hemoglobin [Roseiarcus fermentans]RBP08554.1 truncated hemoglobin YjbI [Roseiarcus fermentans]
MNLTESAPSPGRPHHHARGPLYPAAGDPAPTLGGFAFSRAAPPHAPGVFALTLAVDGRDFPVVIGEGEDVAAALDAAAADLPPLPGAVGRLWLERAHARQRAHIVRDLVHALNPPRNTEDRSARAPAAIAALAPDLAVDAFPAVAGADGATVSEEALDRLVRAFYATARKDRLIGPVFSGAIADWERHTEIVQDFWSRTLLDTTRYRGFPFTVHLPLKLKPEHFDRWLEIFRATAAEVLPPEAARAAILKVEHMSVCFQAGLTPVAIRGQ